MNTYHDSCYLGRYNNVFDASRVILKSIPAVSLNASERKREIAMCCGAGGGLYGWRKILKVLKIVHKPPKL